MTSSTATDPVLGRIGLSGAQAESQEDFERLIGLHRFALMRLASAYTATVSDREDLLQEIAFAIWQALPSFRHECSERTFLFRIAHNRALTWLARTSSHKVAMEDAEYVPDSAPAADAVLVQQDARNRLMRAVRALPMDYRQVVLLMLEDMTYAEISAVLGLSETNVGARLSRARQMLRKLLEGRP